MEVDGTSLVGVTQSFAASVLRNTSGSVRSDTHSRVFPPFACVCVAFTDLLWCVCCRFIIGREKPGEQSEVAQLIQQTLEQERWQREMMEQRYKQYMDDDEEVRAPSGV